MPKGMSRPGKGYDVLETVDLDESALSLKAAVGAPSGAAIASAARPSAGACRSPAEHAGWL